MEEKTIVVFRKFRGNDKWNGFNVLAIFPEIPGDGLYTCSSYMHIGQHGSCDPYALVGETDLATPEEYADLKKELEGLEYNLVVRRRITHAMHEKRFDELYRMMR
jgi:hypothetical protein